MKRLLIISFFICSSLQAQTWADDRYKMFQDSAVSVIQMELIGVDKQYDTYLVYTGEVYPFFDYVDSWIVLYTQESPIWISRSGFIDMWLQEPPVIIYKR